MGIIRKKARSLLALIHLSADEVRKLAKPRTYFDVYADKLLDGYEAHIDQLRIKGLDVADVRTSLAAYHALGPEEEAAERQLALIRQTRGYHASKVWSTELEIYVRGRVAARTDDEVADFIAEFEQFMKRPRKKSAPAPTPVVKTEP